jgi:hypothetical protein
MGKIWPVILTTLSISRYDGAQEFHDCDLKKGVVLLKTLKRIKETKMDVKTLLWLDKNKTIRRVDLGVV